MIIENDTISIVSQRSIIENNIIIGKSFRISFWDIGTFSTPSYYIKVKKNDNKGYQIEAEKLLIHIKSVLASNDSMKVRPIKGPIEVSRVVPYKMITKIIVIVVLIYFILIVWKKRQVEKNHKNTEIFYKNPSEIAKNRILDLETSDFTKEFYTELSHIFREFIENSLYINTLEMTTEEIKENKSIFPVNQDIFYEWVKFLEKADLIKYAKFEVPFTDMDKDKIRVIAIIEKFSLEK